MMVSVVCAVIAPLAEAQSLRPTEGVAAIVNDQVISFSDVRSRAGLVLLGVGPNVNDALIAQMIPRVMLALIDEKLKILEAEKFEIKVSDEDIDAQFSAIAASNDISAGALAEDLQRRGVNPDTLRQRIRADIAWRRVITGLYGSRVRVSDSQVDQAVARQTRISRQERFRVAEILLPATSDADKASALRVAYQLYDQVTKGARFEAMAQRYSGAVTAATGGDLGWLSRSDLPDALADTIVSLPRGGLSEPVIGDAGVYLLTLIDRQVSVEPDQLPLRLKQAVGWSSDTRSALESLAASGVACEELEPGQRGAISIVDPGEVRPSALDDQFRQSVLAARTGDWTPILPYGEDGLAMILVCGPAESAPGALDRTAIENQIYEQQLTLLASRHLRNLRRSATIIRRDELLQ